MQPSTQGTEVGGSLSLGVLSQPRQHPHLKKNTQMKFVLLTGEYVHEIKLLH